MALSGLVPDAPTPPNPMQTAAAQTGTNVSTAIANSYLGNVNQQTPQGNLNYNVTDTFNFTDPTSGQTFSIPRWTAQQTLTQEGQQAFNAQQGAQVNLANMAQQQSGALGNLLSTPFKASQGNFDAAYYLAQNPDVAAAAANQTGETAPEFAARHWAEFGQNEGRSGGYGWTPPQGDINLFNQAGMPQSSFDWTPGAQYDYASGGDIRSGIDPTWDITRSYGPQDNFSADRNRIEASLMERLNPQLAIERSRTEQQLADRGIRQGAYNTADQPGAYNLGMDAYSRMANDARLAVIGQAGQEQQRMSEMARAQATFENMAQAQGFSQAQARAMFYNQAQQQREAQAAARGGFYNQAAAQNYAQAQGRGQFYNQAQAQALARQNAVFNAQTGNRNQWLQEQYQQRSQPLNEISALLSGSQVQQPNFVNAPRNQIPTTDVAGLINQGFAQQNDIYKTGLNFWGDVIGGSLGAAGSVGGAYLKSDRDSKDNVVRMGSVFSDKGSLPIYRYSYKDDPAERRHVGPMAQDVEKLDPRSVKEIDGEKHIDLHRMGSVFGLRRAA